MKLTHYRILDILENATSDEIVNSFQRLSLIWHFDNFKSWAEPEDYGFCLNVYERMNTAYKILHDPQTRRVYDLELTTVKPDNSSKTEAENEFIKKYEGLNLQYDQYLKRLKDPKEMIQYLQQKLQLEQQKNVDLNFKSTNSQRLEPTEKELLNTKNELAELKAKLEASQSENAKLLDLNKKFIVEVQQLRLREPSRNPSDEKSKSQQTTQPSTFFSNPTPMINGPSANSARAPSSVVYEDLETLNKYFLPKSSPIDSIKSDSLIKTPDLIAVHKTSVWLGEIHEVRLVFSSEKIAVSFLQANNEVLRAKARLELQKDTGFNRGHMLYVGRAGNHVSYRGDDGNYVFRVMSKFIDITEVPQLFVNYDGSPDLISPKYASQSRR